MFLGYQNNKIKFYTEQPLNPSIYNVDRWEETEDEYILDGEEYVIKDEAWEQEQRQKEKERIGNLSMTRGDVFEALILAKNVSKTNLRQYIEEAEGLTDIERVLYLNRFDEALEFYRKYPAIDLIGNILEISSEQMDRFFETRDWHELVISEEKPISGSESEESV